MPATDRKVLVRDFSIAVRRKTNEDGLVLGWSGWFARSTYGRQLPVTNGQVLSVAAEFPEAKWQDGESTDVSFTVDDTWVTVDAQNEHALRLGCNYLLKRLVDPRNVDVRMRRTWRFNVYEEEEKEVTNGAYGLFDDNDDW